MCLQGFFPSRKFNLDLMSLEFFLMLCTKKEKAKKHKSTFSYVNFTNKNQLCLSM